MEAPPAVVTETAVPAADAPKAAAPYQFYSEFDTEELEIPPFEKAIEKDDVVLLERLLQLGASPNARSLHDSNPPLLIALTSRSVKCARALLKAGADLRLLSVDKATAHHQAVFYDNDADEGLSLIEEHGLTFEHPVFAAAYHGRVQELEKMTVGELQSEDSLAFTPLHYAAAGGHVAALKFLIEHLPSAAAAVSHRSKLRARTPLHCAVMRDRTAAIEFLLANGASSSQMDERDNLLILAARLGRLQSLKWFLERKMFDLETRTGRVGDTALSIGTFLLQHKAMFRSLCLYRS